MGGNRAEPADAYSAPSASPASGYTSAVTGDAGLARRTGEGIGSGGGATSAVGPRALMPSARARV